MYILEYNGSVTSYCEQSLYP